MSSVTLSEYSYVPGKPLHIVPNENLYEFWSFFLRSYCVTPLRAQVTASKEAIIPYPIWRKSKDCEISLENGANGQGTISRAA